MTRYQSAILADLPPHARLLLPILEARAKGHPECWSGNASLARALGCCERTIRNALKALRAAKLIDVARDYTLKSRRRILLLFNRRGKDLGDGRSGVGGEGSSLPTPQIPPPNSFFVPSVAANPAPDSTAEFAARSAPPLEPPYMVPEGKYECGMAASGISPPPPEGPIRSHPGGPDTTATPEQVAELVDRAAKLCGDAEANAPGIAGRIRAFLARWGRRWLQAALDRAEKRAAYAPLDSPFGYLYRTLLGFQADGGPPPAAAPPSPCKIQFSEEVMEEFAEIERRIEEQLARRKASEVIVN